MRRLGDVVGEWSGSLCEGGLSPLASPWLEVYGLVSGLVLALGKRWRERAMHSLEKAVELSEQIGWRRVDRDVVFELLDFIGWNVPLTFVEGDVWMVRKRGRGACFQLEVAQVRPDRTGEIRLMLPVVLTLEEKKQFDRMLRRGYVRVKRER